MKIAPGRVNPYPLQRRLPAHLPINARFSRRPPGLLGVHGWNDPKRHIPERGKNTPIHRRAKALLDHIREVDPKNTYGFALTEPFPRRLIYDPVKRTLDIVGSIVGLVVLSPLMLVTYLMVLKKTGRPIFFTQLRVGRRGATFYVVKFTTMKSPGVNLRGRPKKVTVTPLGRFLRKYSIDELPQLVNVLLGHMSLVGPRPRVVTEVNVMKEAQGDRMNIRPGLSCLAAIRGRNLISDREAMKHDKEYIQRRGFFLDVWIILVTIVHVVRGKNAR